MLPSYDTQTRVTRNDKISSTRSLLWVVAGFTLFFICLEMLELDSDGALNYFSNMWNVLDWLNFILFFFVWGLALSCAPPPHHAVE